jgi:hypothetical protein
LARAKKQTADYFPHVVKHGTTLRMLEARWKNDGYAFWFKLLEQLCNADGHSYDCSQPVYWEDLIAVTGVSEEVAQDMLDKLASIGAIHQESWLKHRGIWCQNLVDNLEDLYSRRTTDLPTNPFLHKGAKSLAGTAKPKGELKEKDDSVFRLLDMFEAFWELYPNPSGKKPARDKWLKLKPDAKLFTEIMESVKKFKQTEQWKTAKGRYVPMASTFLNQERWKDEVQEGKKAWNDFGE